MKITFIQTGGTIDKDYPKSTKGWAFEISEPALKSAKRKIKNTIKLDTNIQIKLDFNNPETSAFFIEKGFDDVRGMYFYKVFFNEEKE